MAPEALNNLPYNETVDIFSFGVILRLLLTGDAVDRRSSPKGGASEGTLERPADAGLRPLSTAMELLIGT